VALQHDLVAGRRPDRLALQAPAVGHPRLVRAVRVHHVERGSAVTSADERDPASIRGPRRLRVAPAVRELPLPGAVRIDHEDVRHEGLAYEPRLDVGDLAPVRAPRREPSFGVDVADTTPAASI